MAERGRFELPVALRPRQFSKLIRSTTPAPLLQLSLCISPCVSFNPRSTYSTPIIPVQWSPLGVYEQGG